MGLSERKISSTEEQEPEEPKVEEGPTAEENQNEQTVARSVDSVLSKRPGLVPPSRAASLDQFDRRNFAVDSSHGYARHSDTGISSMVAPSRHRASLVEPPQLFSVDEQEAATSDSPLATVDAGSNGIDQDGSSTSRSASESFGADPLSQQIQIQDQIPENFDRDASNQHEMGTLVSEAATAAAEVQQLHGDDGASEDFVFQQSFPVSECEDRMPITPGPKSFRRTDSYINSLPVVSALPDPQRHGSIVAEIREVVPIGVDLEEAEVDVESPPVRESASAIPIAATHPLLQERERAALISVHILKDKNTPVGMELENAGNYLYVRVIHPNGILDKAPLNAGHKILSLDGTPCVDWSGEKAMEYIKNKQGFLSILAENHINGRYHLAEACVCKIKPTDKVGLTFKSEGDKLYISNINTSALLGNLSVLNTGDQVVSINDDDCDGIDPRLAKRIVRDSPKLVSIVVSTMNTIHVSARDFISRRFSGSLRASISEPPQVLATEVVSSTHFGRLPSDDIVVQPALISVVVFKPGVDTNLGLELMNSDGGKLVVKKVFNSGLFAPTPLKEGVEILSINSRRCGSWVASRAMEVLEGTMGRISVIVMNPLGDDRFVEAMVMKTTPRVKIGIGFKSSRNQLKISTINPGGLLADSVLNSGDSVISINGVACNHFSASQASAMAKRFCSIVTILTKTQHSSGVVVSEINSSRRGSALNIPLATAQRTPDPNGQSESESGGKIKYYLLILAAACAFIIIFSRL